MPRPGKEGTALVLAETYSRLIDRIAELEAELVTEEERKAQEEEIQQLLVSTANSHLH